MDVYLEPTFNKELHVLWKGVKTFNACQEAPFNLKVMCMWNIHDFPTYRLFTRSVTKGLVGCPFCGPTIEFQSLKKFEKVIYYCYLPKSHPYRRAHDMFNGEIDNQITFICIITSNTIKWGKKWKTWLQGFKNKSQNLTLYTNMASINNITSCSNFHTKK